MLSKKLTFSLTSLIVLIAVGFAFAPAAFAQGVTLSELTGPLPVLSTIDELDEVVKKADRKYQKVLYAAPSAAQPTALTAVDTLTEIRNLVYPDGNQNGTLTLYLRIHNGHAVLKYGDGGNPVGANDVPPAAVAPATSGVEDYFLHPRDLNLMYLDKNGVNITPTGDSAPPTNTATTIVPRNTAFPDGQNFEITIANEDIPNNTRYMTVSLGAGAFRNVDPRVGFRGLHGALSEASTLPDPGDPFKVLVHTDDTAKTAGTDTAKDDINFAPLELYLLNAVKTGTGAGEGSDSPRVVSIIRAATATSGRPDAGPSQFAGDPVSGDFQVKVTFTEEPKLALNDADDPTKGYKIADLPFRIDRGKITGIAKGTAFYVKPNYREGDYDFGSDTTPNNNVPATSGNDRAYHPYLLTIKPELTSTDPVAIYALSFDDLAIPPNRYIPPNNASRIHTRSMLHVPVLATAVGVPATITSDATKDNRDGKRSNEIFITGKQIIPAGGYLVLVRGADAAASGVASVSAEKYKDDDKRDRADNQTEIGFKYNVNYGVDFPAPATDLSTFFRNGGTIELRYQDAPKNTADGRAKKTGYHGSTPSDAFKAVEANAEFVKAKTASDAAIAAGGVIISEIMWGLDKASTASQYIELHNTAATDISIDTEEWVLRFNGPTPGVDSKFATVLDTVGNGSSSPVWGVPGQSGVTVADQANPAVSDLVSMSRMMGATDGTAAASWADSILPSINLSGQRIGTPGAANNYTPPVVVTPEPPKPEPKAPVATASDLMITEIMVSSNDGLLPQWIEIANVGGAAVSLTGWSLHIENDQSDADVLARSMNIGLGDVTVGKDQVALVISKAGRNSGMDTAGVARTKGDANAGNFDADRIINAGTQLKPATAQYSILSKMAFRISLVRPAPLTGGVTVDGDVVGNLGMGWELPMADGNNRSSIIRRMMTKKKGEIKGTDVAGWVLGSDTALRAAYETYYGHRTDDGTPGIHKGGGALPVELSKFGAKRDPLTGQVIVTWETQSELNNAGFFIKRSQQKNGQFLPVNPAMIPGAGTVSEVRTYTYTDTTAQPNIVYYYQIEDVSLDGNRQTLTRAHRLKGHVGAAGKATTTWGDLKTSREQ